MKNTLEKINDDCDVIEQKDVRFLNIEKYNCQRKETNISKMPVEQSLESLTGMGLLAKKENVITELVSLRDKKRETYYEKFFARNGGLSDFRNVKWGVDGEGKDCGIRCNANIVLLEIGAKIPGLADGSRNEKQVTPIYLFSLKTLREWGVENLTCSHSS